MTTNNTFLTSRSKRPSRQPREENPYLDCAGYLGARRNLINHGWVVLYRAKDQQIDVGQDKYALVCETHHTILGLTNAQSARPLMRWPEFCSECMAQFHNRTKTS